MASLPLLLRRLGEVIRTLRTQAGYSQERFGFAIGVHRTYMGHLERGTANPTIKILHLVSQGLGIRLPDLLMLAMSEDSAGVPAAGIIPADQEPRRPKQGAGGAVAGPAGQKRRRERGAGR